MSSASASASSAAAAAAAAAAASPPAAADRPLRMRRALLDAFELTPDGFAAFADLFDCVAAAGLAPRPVELSAVLLGVGLTFGVARPAAGVAVSGRRGIRVKPAAVLAPAVQPATAAAATLPRASAVPSLVRAQDTSAPEPTAAAATFAPEPPQRALCGMCGNRGAAMTCKPCGSTFHPHCVGFRPTPECGWMCLQCTGRERDSRQARRGIAAQPGPLVRQWSLAVPSATAAATESARRTMLKDAADDSERELVSLAFRNQWPWSGGTDRRRHYLIMPAYLALREGALPEPLAGAYRGAVARSGRDGGGGGLRVHAGWGPGRKFYEEARAAAARTWGSPLPDPPPLALSTGDAAAAPPRRSKRGRRPASHDGSESGGE